MFVTLMRSQRYFVKLNLDNDLNGRFDGVRVEINAAVLFTSYEAKFSCIKILFTSCEFVLNVSVWNV